MRTPAVGVRLSGKEATIHDRDACFGARTLQVKSYTVSEVHTVGTHCFRERAVTISFEWPKPQKAPRNAGHAIVSVIEKGNSIVIKESKAEDGRPSGIRYVVIEAGGKTVYDSRDDIPCDVERIAKVIGAFDGPPGANPVAPVAAGVPAGEDAMLAECEKVIAAHVEGTFKLAGALAKIRDHKLYTRAGYDTFEAYCKGRWEFSDRRARQLIDAFEYERALPSPATGTSGSGPSGTGWNERQVREFTRLGSPTKAKAVAARVINEVKAKNLKKPTASLIRKHVDEALGIDRVAQAKETKEKREEEDQKRRRWQDEESLIERRTEDLIRAMERYTEGLDELTAEIGEDEWGRWIRDNLVLVTRLTGACDDLATQMLAETEGRRAAHIVGLAERDLTRISAEAMGEASAPQVRHLIAISESLTGKLRAILTAKEAGHA